MRGVPFPVWVAWYCLRHPDGPVETVEALRSPHRADEVPGYDALGQAAGKD